MGRREPSIRGSSGGGGDKVGPEGSKLPGGVDGCVGGGG